MTGRVVAAAAVIGLAGCGGGDRELVGYTRDPAPQVGEVTLPDLSRGGEPFAMRASADGLLVVYFGFTNCPDVCPTTMADLSAARRGLGDDAQRVDVAMVTVDPDRDIPVLTEYVQSFVAGAHALATDDDRTLRTAAEEFGVSYEVVTQPDGGVEVGHSDFLFGVDESGTLVITWPFGTPVDDLEGDIDQLLDGST